VCVCVCAETNDACRRRGCLLGARCERTSELGHSAMCRCDMRCGTNSLGGGTDAAPVCGDDGQDYVSECELEQTSCINMKQIGVKYNGSCGTSLRHYVMSCHVMSHAVSHYILTFFL